MKRFKIVVATLIVAIFGLGLFAFTIENYNSNAFVRTCYKLKTSIFYTTTIETDILNDQSNNSSELFRFTDLTNWETTIAGDPPPLCNSHNYVCAICFEGSLGLTLQEALNGIAAKIEAGLFNFSHDISVLIQDGEYNIVVDCYERTTPP